MSRRWVRFGSRGLAVMETTDGTEHAVFVQGVWRSFGGAEALRAVDFTASAGEVTGMVGPNGAGKTTLLLILATLLAPDQGVVRLGGYDPMSEAAAVRRIMGWVPDTFGIYENLTCSEYLIFSGATRQLSRAAAAVRATELLELVHLDALAAKQVHLLSRGQKQRLGFASALVHHPRILLLDEPAAGLDPSGRLDFLRVVRQLAADGTAVIVSSHVLSDLEQVADRVVFIDRGATVGERRLRQQPDDRSRRYWRMHALDDSALVAALAALGVTGVVPVADGVDIAADSEEMVAGLVAALVGAGIPIVSCAPVQTSLEATYFELTAPE
jgi:ABC-2 type transport system ATP-binding protein